MLTFLVFGIVFAKTSIKTSTVACCKKQSQYDVFAKKYIANFRKYAHGHIFDQKAFPSKIFGWDFTRRSWGGGGGDLEVGIYTHKGLSAFGNMRLVLIFINI